MRSFYKRLTDLARISNRLSTGRERLSGACRVGFGVLALVLLGHAPSFAQVSIGNEFITLSVENSPESGRIWIAGKPNQNPATDFLYQGLKTSFLVFRVTRNGQSNYVTNVPTDFLFRPYAPGQPQPIEYKKYDSLYSSTDTIAVGYKNIYGFNVTMRYILERPTSVYDSGSDILMECDFKPVPFAPAGEFGLYMMLDCFNRDAQGAGGSGDQSSVITTDGYFPSDNFGKKWTEPFDVIPDYYHVGNFRYSSPLNTIFPIHRLKGYSHGGAPLTSPDIFAIGNWHALRSIGWDPPADIGSQQVKDVATVLRWSSMNSAGVIRTAFGLNDEGGNSNFICRDENIFVDMRAVRVVKQAVKNGPYTPSQVDVEMWVTNLSDRNTINPYMRLVDPIRSLPSLTNRLTLDPSTPAVLPLQLGPKVTKKITWRLNINPNSKDTLAQIRVMYKPEGQLEREIGFGCVMPITINGVFDTPPPPPQDTMPPVIQFTGPAPSRVSATQWNYSIFDQHPGYNYDSGLDRVEIGQNDGNNFTLKTTPSAFKQCDRNVIIGATAEVIDASKPARILFYAYDCKGHRTADSAFYTPVVDPFPPEVIGIDSLERNGPPCNTKVFIVTALDSAHDEPFRKDFGFGSVVYDAPPVNFSALELNPFGATPTIFPYDRRAQFRLRVIDSMLDASAKVRMTDFAGNTQTIDFNYCTQPDTQAPIAVVTPLTTSVSYDREWTVDISDKRAWDRGLLDVVALTSDPNFVFTPPAIKPGDNEASFAVGLVDDSKDGQIVLEVRDMIYATTPAGHADTVTIRFNRMPDERAPNVVFTPVPGTNGSEADVDVNDIHYDGATLYKYDLGLKTVRVADVTPNMSVSTINYSAGDSKTTFRVKVLDTLALIRRDSICIEAVDLAGNRTVNCYYYPVVPDTIAPIFVGELTSDFNAIVGMATDSRQYDRGLGAITIEDPVNIDPTFAMTTLNGAQQATVRISVIDPTAPIGGTLVIRDVIATIDASQKAQAMHRVKIPFYVPAVAVAIKLPEVIEGGTPFRAAIVAADTLPTGVEGQVDSISFVADYANGTDFRAADVSYVGAVDGSARTVVVPGTGRKLQVTLIMDQTRKYLKGDTLGYLAFSGIGRTQVTRFDLKLDRSSARVNAGTGRIIEYRAAQDTARSVLKLPAPTFTLGISDSTTHLNGTCDRVLVSTRQSSKLIVLGVRPQPARIVAGESVAIDVKNLPATGARAELVSSDGRRVSQFQIGAGAGDVTRVQLPLPSDLNSGVYQLRITGESGTDVVKIVVSE